VTEQMQDHIEKLDDVDEMLEEADSLGGQYGGKVVGGEWFSYEDLISRKLCDARRLLQLTTDLLRQDYAQIARAKDAAVELLTVLREEGTYFLLDSERARIAKVIALLDGSAEEGKDE